MRLRAPHSSFPTGDARRAAPLDPSAVSAGASRTAIPRTALGLFIALSLAACTVPGPLSKAQTDRLTSPDLAVRHPSHAPAPRPAPHRAEHLTCTNMNLHS